MKNALPLVLSAILFQHATAQTTLFTEDFEGATPAFTLNTTDAGSVISVWNTWVINNSYTGGNGDLICFGFPFTYTIVNTPAQPAGITAQNGNYLHTASVEGIADGITCCSFGAADGLCISADNTFSRMTNDVSTIGYTSVDFNFWWVCEGGSSYYGQVYYSTNGGSSWTATAAPSQYNFQGSWTQQTLNLPAFANQATLRFGFRFVNAVGTGAVDPGFAIDDVAIVAQTGTANSIACSVPQTAVCPGTTITVTCTATGTFVAGNVFNAQLSDALGSFAAPVVIGSIAATTSTAFGATIPLGTPAGTGYLVRVVSSNPVVTGSASAPFEVLGTLSAGADAAVLICGGGAPIDLSTLLFGADAGGTWAPSGPIVSPTGSGTYSYTVTNGCGTDVAMVTVTVNQPPDAGADNTITVCEGDAPFFMFNQLGGSPQAGGAWTVGGSPHSTVFDPAIDISGCYQYTVTGFPPCANDVATLCITVTPGPNAGADTAVSICKATGSYALFNLLGGSPDLGGSWTNTFGTSFSGTFNSASNPGGDYTYTVAGSGGCAASVAIVTIALVDQANAGNATSTTICDNSTAVPLINLLGGSPDLTGYWLDPLGSVTNANFDPGIDAPGNYTYVVVGSVPCPNDTAGINITVQAAPDAGTSGGTATICTNASAFDLITLLGGTPDAGGVWTGPGGSTIPAIVDPATATSGAYSYTVDGAPACSDATSVIAVLFIVCNGIEEVGTGAVQWLGTTPDGEEIFTPNSALRSVKIFDALGRPVRITPRVKDDRLLLDMGSATPGVYLVELTTTSGPVVLRIAHSTR